MCFSFSSDVHSLHFIACTVSQRFPFLHLCQSPVEWWVIHIRFALHYWRTDDIMLYKVKFFAICSFISHTKHLILCSVECSDFSPPVAVLLLIFLCLEALLFLTFTAVMFGTQIHSICNDETVSRLTKTS